MPHNRSPGPASPNPYGGEGASHLRGLWCKMTSRPFLDNSNLGSGALSWLRKWRGAWRDFFWGKSLSNPQIRLSNGMTQVTLRNETIRKILTEHHLTEKQIQNAISEYIWNGLDANASIVELNYTFGGGDVSGEPHIRKLTVKDNGEGIDYYKLDKTFGPFYDSEKSNLAIEDRHHSTLHGKNGIGRLAFSAFAKNAKWTTIFQHSNKKRLKYNIEISDNSIKDFNPDDENKLIVTKEDLGTFVEFSNFKKLINHSSGYKPIENTIFDTLKREFGWKLELLSKQKDTKILINGTLLNYEDNINERDTLTIKYPGSEIEFDIQYIQWKQPLIDEFSRFYFINSKGVEIYKETTKFNNKGDCFYHSIFIQSSYFDNFEFNPQTEITRPSNQNTKASAEFKYLDKEVRQYLKLKRTPFLRDYANKIINEFERLGYITRKNKSPFELLAVDDLETVIKELYVIEPRIFSELGSEQIQTVIDLFQLVLNSESRKQILTIMDKVVKLDHEERTKFTKILELSELNRIINTVEMISERYSVLKTLREVVFNKAFGANERDHLQKIISANYWIFGEEYNLVSEDVDFEKALRNYLYIIRGVKKDVWMKNPDKYDRMDLFLSRQDRHSDTIRNVIIELKHPTKVNIGLTEWDQVMRYMQIISQEPQFSGDTFTWDFYLIGSQFDSSKNIEALLENNQNKGISGLALQTKNYRIFVKKWIDVIAQCELRHDFINEKLKLKKGRLVESLCNPDQAVKLAQEAALKIMG